jgi:5S rRNA maturation endonuclease (ribonuclease M5)
MSNFELYNYINEFEVLLFQVVRLEPKRFFQRRWNGKEWIYNLDNVRKVLYRLPEVIRADRVFIVEGEKDVHTLEKLGLKENETATTCAGGSNSWKKEYNEYFKDKEVIIIPDNDDAGKQFGKTVARGIFPYAKTVKILELKKMYPPYNICKESGEIIKRAEISKGYDITNWANEGNTLEELISIINNTNNYVTLKDLELEEPKLKEKPKYLSNSTNENSNGVTKDMVTNALQTPIEDLIPVNEKTGKATCINSDHNDTEASMDCRGNFGYCYGCGKHYSVIDIFMQLYNIDFKEAVRRMNQ